MPRQELEQYCRELRRKNTELYERRSAEFDLDQGWGDVAPQTVDQDELEKHESSLKLQRKNIERQAEEIEGLKQQIASQEDVGELKQEINELKLELRGYQGSLEGARLAAEQRRDELQEKIDEVKHLQKELEKEKQATGESAARIRQETAKQLSAQFVKRENLIQSRLETIQAEHREEQRTRMKQLGVLRQIYKQLEVMGGRSVLNQFNLLVDFAKHVVNILSKAEKQGVFTDRNEADEDQEISSVDIAFDDAFTKKE